MIACAALAIAGLVAQDQVFASRSGGMQLVAGPHGETEYLWKLRGPYGVEWERTMPHSVAQAFVCEDGTIVAFGNTLEDHVLALTIVGPRRHDDKLRELHPATMNVSHVGSFPRARGVLAWESLDLCAFWVKGWSVPDQLWTYALSDGSRRGVIEPTRALARISPSEQQLLHVAEAIAPGENELFLSTFVLTDPVEWRPDIRKNVKPERGAIALFAVDGSLLWSRVLLDGQYAGAIQVVSSTADDVRCRIPVNRHEWPERPSWFRGPKVVLEETLELHFQRADVSWELR